MPWPNFLIIGAQKAGTTSLYFYLRQHPHIYMCPVKEPMFFTLEGRPRSQDPVMRDAVYTLSDYLALFEAVRDEQAIGEASTAYLPVSYAAKNIKRYTPDVRLIAILRHPIERAYSHYLMNVQLGVEPLPFAQAVAEEMSAIAGRQQMPPRKYLRRGLYYEQLKRYYDLFAPSQIRVFLYKDFRERPGQMLERIFRFLGVADSFVPDMSYRYNQAQAEAVQPKSALDGAFPPDSPARTLLKHLIPARMRQPIARRIRCYTTPPAGISLRVRQQLRTFFADNVTAVQEILGRDLSFWLE